MFAEILRNLMSARKITNYKLAKLVHCSQSTIGYWMSGETVPQNRTMQAVADALGVSVELLRGGVDEYGLKYEDWKSLGGLYKWYRECSCRKSLGAVSRASGVDQIEVSAFEDYGYPIAPSVLVAMCGVLNGATLEDVFHKKYADALLKGYSVESTSNVLQSLRDEDRALLEVARGMTPEQVKMMTDFARSMKGENNE